MKIIILFLLMPFIVFSQNNSITSSSHYERLNANHDNYYFNIKDNIFYVKILKEYIVLEKFSLAQNQLVESKFLPALDKNEQFETIIKIGEKYYFFYSYWDKKNNFEQLFSYEIDFENLSFKSKIKVLENDEKLNGILVHEGLYEFETTNKYRFSISKDKKNYLLAFKLKFQV